MAAIAVGRGARRGRRQDRGLGVEQFEDALGGRHGALQDVVFLAEVLNRPEESQAVLQERHQNPQRQPAAFDAQAAISQHGRERQHRNELDHRIEPAVRRDGVLIRVHMLAVDAVEFPRAAPLAIEKLQHHDSGDVLLQVGVDLGDGHADAPVALRHAAPENQRGADYERHGGHQDAGEQGAQPVHDGDDETEHQKVAQDGDEAGGEQIVEHVDVGGDAGDQAAHGVAVVEGQVETLQVFHELLAQVEHGELAGPLHQDGLGEFGDEGAGQHDEIEQRDAGEAGPRVGRQPGVDGSGERMRARADVLVDGQPGEQGIQHLQEGLREQEEQGKEDQRAIGPHIAQQAAHQAGVISFTEYLFFHVASV